MPAIRRLLAPFARRRTYAAPPVAGFTGWLELPFIGVVAFVGADGALVVDW